MKCFHGQCILSQAVNESRLNVEKDGEEGWYSCICEAGYIGIKCDTCKQKAIEIIANWYDILTDCNALISLITELLMDSQTVYCF